MQFKVFANLKQPVYLFVMLGSSVLLFDLQYLVMKNLPGSVDLMCVEGGNFTAENVIFSIVLSLMVGMTIAGIIALFKQRQKKIVASSLSGFALLIGSFTVFCTACTLPFVSLFGFSVGLRFFTDYNLIFKIISLLAMVVSLYLVNKQLVRRCEKCEIGY